MTIEEIERKRLLFEREKLSFDSMVRDIFNYQYHQNDIYNKYCNAIGCHWSENMPLVEIPFLPIQFFKTHAVKTGEWKEETVFKSSGTSGQLRSRHLVYNKKYYHDQAMRSFESFYGPIKDMIILGLLPSYIENGDSSLVSMIESFIVKSQHPTSGFYLNEFEELHAVIENNKGQTIALFGVTYALLDILDQHSFTRNKNLLIFETGGMKGRRKELVKSDLYSLLKSGFGVKTIYSEYGMTELLSQAYTVKEQVFTPSMSMKILVREINDPFDYVKNGKQGLLNVIDLMNYMTCSFIATDDVGTLCANGDFQILGRMDHSEIRGCNLLYPT